MRRVRHKLRLPGAMELVQHSAAGGTQSVSPSITTIYKATAIGTGPKATAAATVTVNPQPTVTITANPALTAPGSPLTLSVNAADATQVTS